MKTYTITHTATTTTIATEIKSSVYKENISYEFSDLLTNTEISKVFKSLTNEQQESVVRTKRGFKQFVRAIILAYPTASKDGGHATLARSDEAKRLALRLGKHLGLSSKVVLKNILTTGTLNETRMASVFTNNPNTKYYEKEGIVYNDTGDFLVCATERAVARSKDGSKLYVYILINNAGKETNAKTNQDS